MLDKIAGVPKNEFLEVAEEVMARFILLPENPKPERTGGYLAVLERSNNMILLLTEIGSCPLDMSESINIVQEKAHRLFDHLDEGHISSWQSRDVENQMYGGAITAPNDSSGIKKGREIIGAFSGLVEHGDEAVILVTWMIFRWIALDDAREIVSISKNELFNPLLNSCKDLFDREVYI